MCAAGEMEWQLTAMGNTTRWGGGWEARQGQCSKAEEFDLEQFTKASCSSVAALSLYCVELLILVLMLLSPR